MKDKSGVIVISFDLPMETKKNKADYRKFLSELKKRGFLHMQNSLYYKRVHNLSNINDEKNIIQEYAPEKGNILMIPLTKSVLSSMKEVVGKKYDVSEVTESVFCY